MASAKKCDICGKLYETPKCNDVVAIILDTQFYSSRCIDLCDNCYTKLCDFVKPAIPEGCSVERKKME